MWRAYDRLGFLQYSFIETVEAMKPYYVIRAIGGLLFVAGSLIMAWNVWKTIRGDAPVDQKARIDRYEGGGEGAFGRERAEQVRQAESDDEGVGDRAGAEDRGEDGEYRE